MTEFEYNINKEIDIATWEDEAGAFRMQLLPPKKQNTLIVCLGLLVTLPLIYLAAKKVR